MLKEIALSANAFSLIIIVVGEKINWPPIGVNNSAILWRLET